MALMVMPVLYIFHVASDYLKADFPTNDLYVLLKEYLLVMRFSRLKQIIYNY